jgi:hypothetical protein
VVIDRDQLRGVARLRFRLRDNDGDALADMPSVTLVTLRQWRALGAVTPAHILGHDLGIERSEIVGGPVLAGEDGKDTRHLLRRGLVDAADLCMGMRRKIPAQIARTEIAHIPFYGGS